MVTLRKLEQSVQFDLQVIRSHINLVQNGLNVTDNVGVKAHSKDHPNNGNHAFIVSDSSHISIANSGQRLECPVHRGRVLMGRCAVDEI